VTEAIQLMERLVHDFRMDCDFQRIPGYLYADRPAQLRALEEEYQAISKAGIPCNRTSYVPLPYAIEEAILVPDQARIDPLKYVQGLAMAFQRQGGRIFEHSRVLDIQSATFDPHNPHGLQISTVGGEVLAQDVVLATHTPIGFRPMLQSRLEAIRSYIIGIRTDDMPNDALYWDMHEPYHYIRLTEDEHGPLILIGGEDHKPGEIGNPQDCFRRLELFAAERFAVRAIDYHWSAQFFDSADGLPYIGKSGDLYIATGLSGEGLTFGTLAARMITDQICGIHHACQDILSPTRTKPLASASGMLSEGLHAMSHFIRDRLRKPDVDEPAHVPVGEGAICQIEGKKVAVYHAPDGELHLLSPVCTHMNCIVGWNPVEKSWDCPCHGGRFDPRGQVLNGPPVRNLAPIEIQESKPKT
jgi:glycine/D-amino acid oxidase-like deaminating enzyme/nitrite reductase/ring-hydroxylating ferredoxin subunit